MTQSVAPVGDPADVVPYENLVLRLWRSSPTLVRYGLAGGTTQLVYLAVLATALASDVYYLAGVALAQIAAICYAFPVYRRHVFIATGPRTKQFLKFLGIWWTGAAMSFIGVPALVEGLGIKPFGAQLLIFIPVFTFSFSGHVGLTFRRPGRQRV